MRQIEAAGSSSKSVIFIVDNVCVKSHSPTNILIVSDRIAETHNSQFGGAVHWAQEKHRRGRGGPTAGQTRRHHPAQSRSQTVPA